MMGFVVSIPGVVGGICGLLACVASSILMCCAPKSTAEGGGKFTAVRKSKQATTIPASQTPQPNAHSYPILAMGSHKPPPLPPPTCCAHIHAYPL